MSVKDTMDRWGREYLNERHDDVVPEGADIKFDDYAMQGGYCDTCATTEYSVDVWATVEGRSVSREWTGRMSELIRAIIQWEAAQK